MSAEEVKGRVREAPIPSITLNEHIREKQNFFDSVLASALLKEGEAVAFVDFMGRKRSNL